MRARGTTRAPGLASDLALWALAAAATYLLLWPALWAAPIETLGGVLGFVRANANPSHAAAAEDGIGPLYYPLVFLVRSTPLTLLGLVLLAVLRPIGSVAGAAVALALFSLGFGLAMTVSAKHFDRYLLPAFPCLDLLAGLGYWQLIARLRPASRSSLNWTSAATALAVLIVGLSGWWIVRSWPYVTTYANPLAGGPERAAALIATGWGEGLDRVAAYLDSRPNAGRLKVGMPGEIYTTVLDAQFRGQVAPIDPEAADAAAYDYVVVYTRNRQLGEQWPLLDHRFLRWKPEATISLDGVEYAWVYNSAQGAPVGAAFGDLLALEGYGLDTATPRSGRGFELRLRWRPLGPVPPDLQLVAEFRPTDGGPMPPAQVQPLSTGEAIAWQVGVPIGTVHRLAPAGRPGVYVLAIRVTDAEGRPLPLTRPPQLGPEAAAEPDAVALRGVQLR